MFRPLRVSCPQRTTLWAWEPPPLLAFGSSTPLACPTHPLPLASYSPRFSPRGPPAVPKHMPFCHPPAFVLLAPPEMPFLPSLPWKIVPILQSQLKGHLSGE